MNQKGFTLLEVMISLALLASMSYFISTATQSALKNKSKIQSGLDENSSLDNALSVMIRDINLAFHHRDAHIRLYNESMKERITNCEKGLTGTGDKKPKEEEENPDQDPKEDDPPKDNEDAKAKCAELKKNFKEKVDPALSEFNGEKDQINFTAKSNIRLRKDSPQSRQNEVGYFVKTCKSRGRNKTQSQCLWRRTSPIIDDDVTKGGTESVLLERLDKLTLRYLYKPEDTDGTEWKAFWKSKEGSDATTKGKFPAAVEITIKMDKTKTKEGEKPGLVKTVIAPLRFANNPTKEGATDAKPPQ